MISALNELKELYDECVWLYQIHQAMQDMEWLDRRGDLAFDELQRNYSGVIELVCMKVECVQMACKKWGM